LKDDIKANSKVEIVTAENDLYVARIDDRVVVKLGFRLEIGVLLHLQKNTIWLQLAKTTVWEKRQ
jgi:hypothetical protein